MQFDPDKVYCHHTGFRKKCSANNSRCAKWIFLQGTNPQTGVPVAQHACADGYLPLLLVDLKKAVVERGAGTQAAVESLRNVVAPLAGRRLAPGFSARFSKPDPGPVLFVEEPEEGPNGPAG